MIKNTLILFIFLFYFPIAHSYKIIAQSDSVFDATDLADIEGLDREDDQDLEEEFGDLSDETVIDNFEVDDFEEENEEDNMANLTDESDENEESFNEDDDYEEISDRPGYELYTDEELDQEFSDEDGDGDTVSDEIDTDEDLDEEFDIGLIDEGAEDELDIEKDSELDQLQEEINQIKTEENNLSENIDEIDDEDNLNEEIAIEPEEDMTNQEEDLELDLEDPEESFESGNIEGLPIEEEEDSLSELNLITNIRYIAEQDKIVIDTSEIASYQERNNIETNQLVIEILQSKLEKNLEWPYVLRDFNTDFGLVKADQKDSTTVRVIIQIKEGADFPKTTLSQDGNQIIIAYGSIVNNDIISDENPISMEGLDSSSILPKKTLEELYFGDIEFSGTPLSFHVIDAPVKQVLRFISEESGLNMVIDESVSGSVTLKLEDVPWDQALHTIFKVKSLGYTRDGNVITILPLTKIEERTQKLAEISRRQKALSPFQTKVIPIMYTKAVDIENKVREFSTAQTGTSQGGKIIVHEESNTLVVVDTAEAIKNIESMARFLDKSPQQVMIE
ncbi:MAG: secretin and TonB N-terminal domain-containing protein, partial [Bdellovibrionaceae bacterium]|nr:secretin and TonB N-terminal domain-containing protein [Pseudobdellovibrionaceae bacterium]